MVLTTNNQGVAALASRMTKPAVIVAPRSNTTRLEDFEIQRKLGKGSFGVVYAVTRRRDPQERKRTYVMKQISMGPSRRDQEEAINECRVLAKLNHAHVVRYHESFVASGNRLCIVMEYAPKGTVHSLVQGAKPRTLSEDVVWRLALQSALGLHHIHSLKILHRDIKAENIFLDKDGNAKIGDLGVAKVMTHAVDFAKTLVGTPYYLSPELCENKPYNHKSDVWSLGCVIYEMMTGSHPFNAQNQGALFVKILKGKYPPVKSGAGKFSPDLVELMDRCLTVNQTRRPDTAGILRSRAARMKAETLGLQLPSDVVQPTSNPRDAFAKNEAPDSSLLTIRQQQRRAATAVGSSRADRVNVNGVRPTETALQAVERIASARGADRIGRRVGQIPGDFRVGLPDGISGLPVGYGGAGGLAYAAARMADASAMKRPSTALPASRVGTADDRTARSAAVVAGIAAAAAGGGVKGVAAAETELRRIRAESARAESAKEGDDAANEAERAVAEDEASRMRRKEAGDAAMKRRREREEEERRAALAERRRARVAAAANAAEESRAKLAAAKAALEERRRQSGRVAGGKMDAGRFETAPSIPSIPSIPSFPSPRRKTALPPSPLQGLAVVDAPRRAPSSRKPTAANPGTVAPARPASAVPVVQPLRRPLRPRSAAERRDAARAADANLVAALPESPGERGGSGDVCGVRTRDVTTGIHRFDRPDDFDEARATAELAAAASKVNLEGDSNREGDSKPAWDDGVDVDVRPSPDGVDGRSRPRHVSAKSRGVVDVAKARRDAAEASRAAVRAAKSPMKFSPRKFSPKKSPKKAPYPSSGRPASAFIRRTGDVFGGVRGRARPVTARDVSDSTSSESSSQIFGDGEKTKKTSPPVVSSYAEAHERRMANASTSPPVKGTAAAAIGVARLAVLAVDHFVASSRLSDDGENRAGAGSGSSTSSIEEISRAAAEAAAAARAAANIVASGGLGGEPASSSGASSPSSSHPRGVSSENREENRDGGGGVPAFVFGDAPDDSPCSTSADFEDSGDARRMAEDGGESPGGESPGGESPADPAGAVARALRATVRALESVLGPTRSPSDEPDAGRLKPFYDDEGSESSESESEPGTPGTSEYYSDARSYSESSDSEERFVKVHGATRAERVEELVSEMTATEDAAVALVGAESFGLLYDFLARRSEAAEDGRLNRRAGTPEKVRELSERVFDIVPREKAEAVALAHRYAYLVERLEAV